MKKTITLLFIISVFTNSVWAYPVSPRPLRQLVKESEFIIVGYVISTNEKEDDKNHRKIRIAKIAIWENLKGNKIKDTIEIEYFPYMICPSPPRYFDSTNVIAFLNKDEDGKLYTHALSYGAKTLEKNEIEIYKKRILEIQQIFTIKNKQKQFDETIEWLVKCAEVEKTRWEGTFELYHPAFFISDFSHGKKNNFKLQLTNEQKQRLKNGLFTSKFLPDFELVDLVYKGNEKEIDAFLLQELRSLNEDEYWTASLFIYKLRHKGSTSEINKILEEFDEIQFEHEKKAEHKVLIDKFLKLVDRSKAE